MTSRPLNGLAALEQRAADAKNTRRKRPEPRHQQKTVDPGPTVKATEPAIEPVPASERAAPATPPPAAEPDPKIRTVARTVQLDAESEDWLDSVRVAGRHARVDANRSAVIRYALRELAAQRSPEKVARALGQTRSPGGPGRKVI